MLQKEIILKIFYTLHALKQIHSKDFVSNVENGKGR